jgi:rare lipoprotein A
MMAACVLASSCAKHHRVKAPATASQGTPVKIGFRERGEATWYGEPYHGRRAASGEVFDMEQLTAAHRTLPFDTWVQVTNLRNRKQVEVRINDRGPFVDGRVIDLSRAAAREIGLLSTGVAPVEVRVIAPPKKAPPPPPARPAAESAGEYVVQVGAFRDRERAEALRASLLLTDDARLAPTASDPPLWRVWIGRKLSLGAATRLAEEAKAITGQAFVVRGE